MRCREVSIRMPAKWRGRGGGWRLVVFLALVWTGSRAWAQVPADPNQLLKELNEVKLDSTQVYVLRDTMIARDRVKLYFNRGFVAFLTPVAGEVTGAVFVGDGEILLIPPNAVEKQNLAQFTQAPILSEPFSSAYLRFTDQTARELLARARPPDPEDTEQPTGVFEPWNPLIRQLNPEHSVRILQDLLGRRDLPFFHARLQGVNLGVFQVTRGRTVAGERGGGCGAGKRAEVIYRCVVLLPQSGSGSARRAGEDYSIPGRVLQDRHAHRC